MFRFIPQNAARASLMAPARQLPSTFRAFPIRSRLFSTVEPMGDYEQKIYDILKAQFEPVELQVRDVSGGCGSMFAITVESPKFKGISMIKQHRLVNEVLKDEIAQWHGLQLKTRAA